MLRRLEKLHGAVLTPFEERFAQRAARLWIDNAKITIAARAVGRIEKRHLAVLSDAFAEGGQVALIRLRELQLLTDETPSVGSIRAVARETVKHYAAQQSFDTCDVQTWTRELEALFVQGYGWVIETGRGGAIGR